MRPGDRLLALAFLLAAGCSAAGSRPDPAIPDAAPGGGCFLCGTPVAAPPAEAPAPLAAPDRGTNPLVLEAARGETVRGRFRSHAQWTIVEVGLKEVVPAAAGEAPRIRYVIRLCTEDGRTEAVALGRSKEGVRGTLFTDSLHEGAAGKPVHHYFSCPYGTAWEIEVIPGALEGGRVRFTVGGHWRSCTK